MKPSSNLSYWAVTHRPFVLFLILATMIGGLISFLKLGRLEDPTFNVPAMSITVAWPGATTEQVQNQVLNKIESKLQEIDGFYFTRTFSRQGYGAILFQIRGGMSAEQLKASWYQARKKVGDIRNTFPNGVRDPIFNDEYSDVYTSLYAIQSNDLSPAEMLEYAEDIKKKLQSTANIKKVDILGQQAQRIYVEFSSKKLASLNIPPQVIYSALQQQNRISPSGYTDTTSDRVFVRVSGAFNSAADVANTPITAGGHVMKLSDIASIRQGYEDPANFTIRHQGRPALVIGTTIQPNANILSFGKAQDLQMQRIKKELPLGLDVTKFDDQPLVVKDSIVEFEEAFLEALVIVLLVSFASLGWRSGLVVAMSVPLVLAAVAMVMYFKGWNLDRVSLGALIISLGLLVDDAIIAVEMMSIKIEQGFDKIKAASFAYTSTAFPMLTGTLITVAGFMPVGFAKSNAGEYAGSIFWVLGTALIASWLVAVVFIPYLGTVLLHVKPNNHAHDPYDSKFFHGFRHIIAWVVQRKWLVIASTIAFFILSILGMGLVQQQFFPTASRPEVVVDLHLRQGSSFSAMQEQVVKLEQVLAADPDIVHFTSYTGAGTARFFLSLLPELPNAGFAQIVILTKNTAAREHVRSRLIDLFNKNDVMPLVRGRVQRLEFGPPVGFPVQFRVMGNDVDRVRAIAYQVRDIMNKSPLVKDAQLEWDEKVRAVHVNVNQEKAQLLGVSSNDIANTVQTILDGAPVTQIPQGESNIDIVLRAVGEERGAIDALADVTVLTRAGTMVPLSQVASIDYTHEEPVIWRRNREINITVNADVADGVQAPYASTEINKQLATLSSQLPTGYHLQMGGAIEESDLANNALAAVFPIMLLATLCLLMLQLQSFSKTIMVFLTAPLGLIGVVPALLAFNAPFGFVALIGIIALSGMIMRNSVILVDQIDKDLASGSTPFTAIVEATIRRTRPVALTALAAFLAMIPLSRSVFWGPMAIAIMGGLLVGTVLTLIFVPALYAAWFKVGKTGEAA